MQRPAIGKKHPLLKGHKNSNHKKGPKRELKTDDEIRKARKVAFKRRQNANKRNKNKPRPRK